MKHLRIRLFCRILPLRYIISVRVLMVNRERVSMKGRNTAELHFSVPVKVQKNRITGRKRMNPFHLPFRPQYRRRNKEIRSLFTRYDSRFKSPILPLGKTMVFQHFILKQSQLQILISMKLCQIFRKMRTETGAFSTPVILKRMSGLQATYQKIPFSSPFQNPETMDERSLTQGKGFPSAFLLRLHKNNFRVQSVIRRIKSSGRQKDSIRSRNLCHGHNPTGAIPNLFH